MCGDTTGSIPVESTMLALRRCCRPVSVSRSRRCRAFSTSHEQTRPRALIVGAGPAGLTAALSLHSRGFDVRVFEKNQGLPTLHGLPGLLKTGAIVLDKLIGRDQMSQLMDPAHYHKSFVPGGRVLGDIDLKQAMAEGKKYHVLQDRLGVTQYGTLLRTLGQSLPAGTIHFGHEVEKVTQDDGAVRVTFTDGKSQEGHVLIGADGCGSTVRRELFPEDPCVLTPLKHELLYASGPLASLPPFPAHTQFTALTSNGTYAAWRTVGTDRAYCGVIRRKKPVPDPLEPSHIYTDSHGVSREEAVGAAVDAGLTEPELLSLLKSGDEYHSVPIVTVPLATEWHSGRAVLVGAALGAPATSSLHTLEDAILDSARLCHSLVAHNTLEACFKAFKQERGSDKLRVQSNTMANVFGSSTTGLVHKVRCWLLARQGTSEKYLEHFFDDALKEEYRE